MCDSKEELKAKTIKGFFWRFGERISSQVVSFVVSVVLARLLEPNEYGVVALTMVFISIASCFAISGLGTSLIQKKKADELDFSTMFHAGLAISIFIYAVLFSLAHYIGEIYHDHQVASILKVLGLILPISSVQSIQQAYVSRQLDFRKFFYATFLGTIISGLIGIMMAYSGFGVWSLVGQQISNVVVNTIILGIVIDWHPQWKFSFKRFRELYSFGVKLMGAQLLGTTFNELKSFVIGVKYAPADLAFFNRGESLPSMIAGNVNNTINAVLFPAISKVQDNKQQVKLAIRRSIMTSSYVMIPIMFMLTAMSDKIVMVLFTEKWMPCVPFMQVLCLNHCVNILGTTNLQAFNAVGRSDITLKLEFIKKPLFLLMLFYTMTIGPLAIAIGNLLYGILATAINAWPNRSLICYKYSEQISDFAPSLLLSAMMMIVIYMIGFLEINIYILLLLQVVIGISFYITISKLLSFNSYHYIVSIIKSYISK